MVHTKKKVALFFGGASLEYAVSLRSAAAVLRALDRAAYEVLCVGLTQEGHWLMTEARPEEIEQDVWQAGAFPCLLSPDRGLPGLWYARPGEAVRRVLPDVLLPMLHGAYGEDGCLQGLFALSGIPFVGSGVAASAMGMDKAVAKTIWRAGGLPVVPWVTLPQNIGEEEARGMILSRLGLPAFLKPACGGSSIGAGCIREIRQLREALAAARAAGAGPILAEAYIPARELEMAVFSDADGTAVASEVGEILPPEGDFYTYAAKYEGGGATLHDRAALSPAQAAAVRQMAVRAYTLLGCRGGARVDFFLCRRTGRLYLNEINTAPGMTQDSMFPRLLCAGSGLGDLLDRMIAAAVRV